MIRIVTHWLAYPSTHAYWLYGTVATNPPLLSGMQGKKRMVIAVVAEILATPPNGMIYQCLITTIKLRKKVCLIKWHLIIKPYNDFFLLDPLAVCFCHPHTKEKQCGHKTKLCIVLY